MDRIIESFPTLFPPKIGVDGESYRFRFECGPGWHDIIYDMCTTLTPLIKRHKLRNPDHGTPFFYRIHEKYGALNVDLYYDTPRMIEVTEAAETKSLEICEQCGAPGSMRGTGWYYVACYDHIRKDGL